VSDHTIPRCAAANLSLRPLHSLPSGAVARLLAYPLVTAPFLDSLCTSEACGWPPLDAQKEAGWGSAAAALAADRHCTPSPALPAGRHTTAL
jgi:hypothetical protein